MTWAGGGPRNLPSSSPQDGEGGQGKREPEFTLYTNRASIRNFAQAYRKQQFQI